jgi:hypothetical protein
MSSIWEGICHACIEVHMEQVVSLTKVQSWSCSKAVYKPVWHIPLLSIQWINSWWWTEELSETCSASCQNKFLELVHIVGFIIKKQKQQSNKKAQTHVHASHCLTGQNPSDSC